MEHQLPTISKKGIFFHNVRDSITSRLQHMTIICRFYLTRKNLQRVCLILELIIKTHSGKSRNGSYILSKAKDHGPLGVSIQLVSQTHPRFTSLCERLLLDRCVHRYVHQSSHVVLAAG
jgi:hypothetical protein